MKFIFLTDEFYSDYKNCKEIAQKRDRPYVQVIIKINDLIYAVPMRSSIKHKHAFFTDKVNRCGIDYSKTVILKDEKYIDKTLLPQIRDNEYKTMLGKEKEIEKGLLDYIELYKFAKQQSLERYKIICKFSTLQYFEEYLEDKNN